MNSKAKETLYACVIESHVSSDFIVYVFPDAQVGMVTGVSTLFFDNGLVLSRLDMSPIMISRIPLKV